MATRPPAPQQRHRHLTSLARHRRSALYRCRLPVFFKKKTEG
jgi:hypothetical protein